MIFSGTQLRSADRTWSDKDSLRSHNTVQGSVLLSQILYDSSTTTVYEALFKEEFIMFLPSPSEIFQYWVKWLCSQSSGNHFNCVFVFVPTFYICITTYRNCLGNPTLHETITTITNTNLLILYLNCSLFLILSDTRNRFTENTSTYESHCIVESQREKSKVVGLLIF